MQLNTVKKQILAHLAEHKPRTANELYRELNPRPGWRLVDKALKQLAKEGRIKGSVAIFQTGTGTEWRLAPEGAQQ